MSCTIVSVYLLRTPFFEINKNKGDCSLETENFNNLEGLIRTKVICCNTQLALALDYILCCCQYFFKYFPLLPKNTSATPATRLWWGKNF